LRSLHSWSLIAALALTTAPAYAGPAAPSAATLSYVESEADSDAVVALLTFSPRPSDVAARELALRLPLLRGVADRSAFSAARVRDFHAMVDRYDMHPNDLATARAFAIVAGYRAYNGARLSDDVSGKILLAALALQTADAQKASPWSDDRKQTMYDVLGGEAAALNWTLERAADTHDAALMTTVHAWARDFLSRQLGEDPSNASPDTFACIAFRDAPCDVVIQSLRQAFAPDDTQSPALTTSAR